MNFSDANRTIWLWLRQHGEHAPSEVVAQALGLPPRQTFLALHAMHRRGCVDQRPPAERGGKMLYGITDQCWVPIGVTVGEVATGKPRTAPPLPRDAKPSRPRATGTRRAWSSTFHRLEQRQ